MISICIPAYEMGGRGGRFIDRSLRQIEAQSYSDHETVVSDQSVDDEIERVCACHPKVRHLRFPRKKGNASANLNHALDQARGECIKIIFEDDFLSGPDSLARMVAGIGRKAWLVHAYWHTDLAGESRVDQTRPHLPKEAEMLLRENTIGAPTALMFKRNELRFDENLRWRMDNEFYYRMLKKFGPPAIMAEPLAVQTLWPGQLTHQIDEAEKEAEEHYLRAKHPAKRRRLFF
jgi:glycosyltransferase involved in cell wall biosynthesis